MLSCRAGSSVPAKVGELGKPGLNELRLGGCLLLLPGASFCRIHGGRMSLEVGYFED